jgi:hypothetical protein
MALYVFHFVGLGEGCDYSIGCNEFTEEWDCTDVKDAREKLLDRLEDHGHDCISHVNIYEVNASEKFDVKEYERKLGEEWSAEEAERLRLELERKDRAEFERLSKKYGQTT